jgi:hypothetical protein
MASWTGGYVEFHEPTGLGDHERPKLDGRPVPAHKCDVCGSAFMSEAELARHRFETHPRTRPALLLRRRALLPAPAINVISSPLTDTEVSVRGTARIVVNDRALDEAALKRALCAPCEDLVTISLGQTGLETVYRIHFDIANAADLKAIDALFLELVEDGAINVSRVRDLVNLARPYRTGGRYVDGLTEYLFGIMAKQQSGGTHIPLEEYRERYNAALSGLADFRTALAVTVVGIVNFNENVFEGSASVAHATKLHVATQYFQAVLFGGAKPAADTRLGHGRIAGRVPADEATERIVGWGHEMAARGGLQDEGLVRASLNAGACAPDDRFKLCVLLAESCATQGRIDDARQFARPYSGHPIFGGWADRFFEHSSSL